MPVQEFIGIGLSLVAILIALHTKYKQREKDRLRDLAGKLKTIRENLKYIPKTLQNPHSHEDLDLRLYEIPRDMLACHYKTGQDEVTISVKIETGYGEDSKELNNSEKIFDKYINGERFHIRLRVGNPDEFYASDRQFLITDPFSYSSYFYDQVSDVEQEFGDVIEDFDEELLKNLKSHLRSMLRQHSNHLVEESQSFSLNVSDFESAEELGEEVFKELYYYNDLEDDIEELERKLEELESFRTTILQTSYS
ncbi:hypothetical protein [Halorussus amylolyticus]|uniref:hypothetical protein n=1 Tax=Halorussus amylolyticus TaxID=1126242 RepID=UPI0010433BB4|nr:hypothetical protein [Halorussus amylolyticus]